MDGSVKRRGSDEMRQQSKRKRCDNVLGKEQTNGYRSSFWSLLPHHVIVTVFLELGARDLVQCSKVCQSWHQTLQDDIVWKKLFIRHWKARPSTALRPKATSWRNEYKRLFLVGEKGPSHKFNVHGGEEVRDLTFSHSGDFLCTSSRSMVVMWRWKCDQGGELRGNNCNIDGGSTGGINRAGDFANNSNLGGDIRRITHNQEDNFDIDNRTGDFEVFNKLSYSTPGKIIYSSNNGVIFTLWNESDEFVLVNGRAMRLQDEGLQMYHTLVYKFPECNLVKSITRLPPMDLNENSNTCWFGRFTFLVSDENEAGFEGAISLYSVVDSTEPNEIVSEDYDIESVAVIDDRTNLKKIIVYAYRDEDLLESEGYCMLSHNVRLCPIIALNSDHIEHECSIDASVACCTNAKYRSSNPSDFKIDESSLQAQHLNAAIRQIDDAMPQKFMVICRPYEKTPHGIIYSDERLDLRIYDLYLNLERVIPLQDSVPPSLFIFEHDYWMAEYSIIIAGDLFPDRLTFHDLFYDIVIPKSTNHIKAVNCAGFSKHGVLCTVSDDGFVKFWKQ